MSFIVVPSIDLRAGKVVRLQQGDYRRQIDYDFDPIATARQFAMAGATWMHLVDLDGAKEGRPAQLDLIGQLIGATDMNVQIGGGIRQTADIQALLDRGAKRVVVGTAALENWQWFTTLVHQAEFANKLVLAVDAKAGMIATRGWTNTTGRRAIDVAREVSDWPLAAILYTDVAKDGMMTGPNYEHTQALAEAGRVPVIASGGVKDLGHIQRLRDLNIWGVIVGRSLHEGTLDLAAAIECASK